MDGIHDMGGMHGFGAVPYRPDAVGISERWERDVHAMVVAIRNQGVANVHEFRHGIERMAPAGYLASGYYERWMASVETLLVDKGVLAPGEVDARLAAGATVPPDDPGRTAELVAAMKARPRPPVPALAPRFAVGDRVRAKNLHPPGHTRTPRYVRAKVGTVAVALGVQESADAFAAGDETAYEHVYAVGFPGAELWGPDAEAAAVHVDLYERDLEPA